MEKSGDQKIKIVPVTLLSLRGGWFPIPKLPSQFTETINELKEGGRDISTNHSPPSSDCLKQQPGRGEKEKHVAKGMILQTDALILL